MRTATIRRSDTGFIADDLHAAGHRASERRVWRLCSQQRLWSLHAKKRGLNRKAGPPVHDDRVRRAFTAPDPDTLWLTDITEHPTDEGKLYLCAIKDACSRRIVGYSISDRMRSSLAVAALHMAISRRNPSGTVIHSDRGSQFRSKKFVRALSDAGLLGSMGRVGACADNAAMRNRSSRSSRRTSSTETLGDSGRAPGARSSPGSKRPTTGNGANVVWGS